MNSDVSLESLIKIKTENNNNIDFIEKKYPKASALFGNNLENIVEDEKEIKSFNLYSKQSELCLSMYDERKREYNFALRNSSENRIESLKEGLFSSLDLSKEIIDKTLEFNVSKSRKAYSYKTLAKINNEQFELTKDLHYLVDSYTDLKKSFINSQNVLIKGYVRKFNKKILKSLAEIGENIVNSTLNCSFQNNLKAQYTRLETEEIIINSLSQLDEFKKSKRLKMSKKDYVRTTIKLLQYDSNVFIGSDDKIIKAINYATDCLNDFSDNGDSRAKTDTINNLESLTNLYKRFENKYKKI